MLFRSRAGDFDAKGAPIGLDGRFGDPGSAKLGSNPAAGGESFSGASRSGQGASEGGTSVRGNAGDAGSAQRNRIGNASDAAGNIGSQGSGYLGSPKMSVHGSETEAAVKEMAQELGVKIPSSRIPASGGETVAESSAAEELSLFDRCHQAHLRCARGGCVR